MHRRLRKLIALACISALAAGCSDKPTDASAATPGAGRQGGRGGAKSVVLAPTDVTVVKQQSISEGVAITGNLRPIETIDVRARIDGDLQGVYVREGDHVNAGQLLARFEAVQQQSDAASAAADRASAQADVSTAKWNLDQTQELFKAGAVPERDYRTAQQTYTAAQARLAATEARVRSTGLSTRDTRVVAPEAGIIDKRMVDNGEHVARGTTMFTLVRNGTLELAATVPERRASAVTPGQRVSFDADGRAFDGRVARVSPTIDPTNRSITVYVDVPNTAGALKGGTFATGSVMSRTVPNALVIPTAALHQSPDGKSTYVYRVSNGMVDQVIIQTGIVDERAGTTEVTGGLAAGDRVIVGNVGTLGRGTRVQVIGADRRQRP